MSAGNSPERHAEAVRAKAAQARRFFETLPYCHALGMRVDQIRDGVAVISMAYDAALVGDPTTGVIHGGAVSALMDTSGGLAVISLPEATATATIDLRIDYMRPATPGQRITARAECYHITRSVVFIRAVAGDEDGSRPVATATGAFTIDRIAEVDATP